jgi:DNA modification methylase
MPASTSRARRASSTVRSSSASPTRSIAPPPGLQIEQVPLDSLIPWPRNPRTISEAQLAALSRSVAEFGMVDPILVRREDRVVIGGHQRLDVARKLGLPTVPVIFLDLSEHQASLLNLALNKISGEWDWEQLGELLSELRDLPEVDVTLSGFDTEEISDLLAELEAQANSSREESFDVEAAMAQAEQQQGPTRVQPGDLWQLGRHRLLCGDCTDPANWERLLAGELAQAVITDPPYAVNYVGGRAAQEARISAQRRGVDQPSDAYWDEMTPEQYRELLTRSLHLAYQHSDEQAPLYLWFASSQLRVVLPTLYETGWEDRNLLVWVKNNGAGALFAQYKHWYEPCFYAFKRGYSPRWHGPTNERTVWEHDKPLANDLHPTMKPLTLIERAIQNATKRRHLVVDAFLGSGTALVAAERTGRRGSGFELDPRYCDVILARWEQATGQQAQVEEG